jgi:hypothetical protein
MSKKIHALPEEQQAKLLELLNRRLADAIDLQLQSRQACWNVKGLISWPCASCSARSPREWRRMRT